MNKIKRSKVFSYILALFMLLSYSTFFTKTANAVEYTNRNNNDEILTENLPKVDSRN